MEEYRISTLERIGYRISASVEKWMPDPFLFAVILTFISYIMGIVIAKQSPVDMVLYWYKGFWTLLTFAMQMVLILVTGYALAYHPAVHKMLVKLASLPKNGKQAAALVAFFAMIFSWINWGLGLIVGALLAREVGRQAYFRGIPVHYPAIVTAGYTGLGMIWHWGLSASAPLLSATEGHFLQDLIGIIPTSETIFSGYSLALSLLSIVFVVGVMYAISPSDPKACRGIEQYAPHLLEEERKEEKVEFKTLADKIENSVIIGILLALMGIFYIFHHFGVQKKGLDLNIVNFTFLFVGLLLYLRPIRYLKAFYSAVPSAAGIVLQFPFYAGIMGMIKFSGLGKIMANWLIGISTPTTFPVVAWLVAGLVNLFVPSGGGEWAVIGETISRAAMELGVPIGKAIIAYGAGDQWTNLFQPFWAIPLLGICAVRARDVFGYCITLMLFAAVFYALALTFIPY
ncbi:short-chain fatty acid transporter [Ferroglobus sp.]|uniref:short-chain fatty acid transporter n=1 Tax=Ferroglobus sp. TaxID=2614230 RepID=UPI0025BABBDA|nr:short-chain fatty acid transporter [Ferroglobus sp.]